MTLTFFEESKQIEISISIKIWGHSVNEVLKGFKFMQAVSKGGILLVVDKSANNTIFKKDISPKTENVL